MSPVEMQGRHGTAAPPKPLGWNCPACGAQNAGPLELGCSACGSGKPGVHTEPAPLQAQRAPVETPERDSVGQAYIRWRKDAGTTPALEKFDPEVNAIMGELLWRSFQAGYVFGVGQTAQTALALSGTAESRTVAAALRLFVDQVLPIAKDEIESGEYLTIEETRKLIERVERVS